MRNNIAYFEKTSSSKVIFWAKLNAKINSALIFPINFTLIRLVFSKEAILFLIYLLADKAKCDQRNINEARPPSLLNTVQCLIFQGE